VGSDRVIDLTRRVAAYDRAVVTATACPKRSRDATVKGRGPADEAVVVVKLRADEGTVTYLRVELSASGTCKRVLEAKGRIR
jgi:hypothetical protein